MNPDGPDPEPLSPEILAAIGKIRSIQNDPDIANGPYKNRRIAEEAIFLVNLLELDTD